MPAVPLRFDAPPEKLHRLQALQQELARRRHEEQYALRDDPVAWVQKQLGEHVWSKQAEVMRAVVKHKRVAVRSAHSCGKSHLASRIAAHWLSVYEPNEAFVITTSPTFAQVRAILWRYIRQAHRKGNLRGRVNQTEWHIGEDLVGFGRKPADETAMQGIHCMSTEHEVLTRRGWLGIEEITTVDEVLSVPVDGDVAEWMPIAQVYRYDFDGDLNIFDGHTVSFAYTDDHRLPVKYDRRSSGHFELRRLGDLTNQYQFTVRRRCSWKGLSARVPQPFAGFGWSAERFARFIGFWVGDGGLRQRPETGRFYEVLLYQTKQPGLDYVWRLVDGLQVFRGRDYVGFSNRACAEWLRDNVGRYQHDRCIPDEIIDAPPEVLEAFCEGLWTADGSTRSDGRRGIVYTTSKVLADQLQEVLVKLGRPGTLSVNRRAGTECRLPNGNIVKCREVYCLSWISNPTDCAVLSSNVLKEKYSGKVWCISTPYETFFTRRNGRVSLSGNSRRVLAILDEACGVEERFWIAVDSLATNDDCRILAIGNPDNSASHFFRVCSPGSSWHKIAISAFDTPNFTDEEVPSDLSKLLISKSWAEEKLAEWGADNPIYRSKVLGEFSTDDPGKVIRGSDVAACRIAPTEPWPEKSMLPIELGVDVGGGGDETVIRERRGRLAGREWREFSDQPSTISPMVLRAILDTGATAVKIDEIGVGRGVIGELENMAKEGRHSAKVVAVNVAGRSRDPDRFENIRAEMWWDVGRVHSQDRLWDLSSMDNADTTVAQLLEPRWEVGPGGRIRIEKKDEVRKRLHRSPDNADALLLAFYAAAVSPAPRVRWLTAGPSRGLVASRW